MAASVAWAAPYEAPNHIGRADASCLDAGDPYPCCTGPSVGNCIKDTDFTAHTEALERVDAILLSDATKTANYVLAGPASGSAATPTWRAMVLADIPDDSTADKCLRSGGSGGDPAYEACSPIINVKDAPYLATGDGTTDDTTAVYAAIAAATAGQTVVVPAGTYIMTPSDPESRVLKSGVTLRCDGGATFKRAAVAYAGSATEDIMFRSANPSTGDSNIRIEGCTFDGNARGNPTTSTTQVPLVYLSRVAGYWITHNRFLDAHTQGFRADLSSNGHVERNWFYRVGQGYCSVTADKPCDDAGDCPAEACTKPSGDPIQINGSISTEIVGNVVENTAEGILCQDQTSPLTLNVGCTIANNTVATYTGGALCTASGKPFACCTGIGTGTDSYGTVGASFCAQGQPQGASIGFLGQTGSIVGNQVRRHWHILTEDHPSLDTDSVTIADNVMTDVQTGALNGAIIVQGHNASRTVSNVRVAGNRIDGSEDAGVHVLNVNTSGSVTVSDIQIEDNTIQGVCSVASDCAALFIEKPAAGTANYTDFVIRGNTVDGVGSGAVYALEGTRTNTIWESGGEILQSPPGLTFTQLPTVDNGSRVYCSDCTKATPCAGSGTGALAKRLNSAWDCD